jgi:hypothetical protein
MSHIIFDRVVLQHLFLLEQMAHGSLTCVKFLGNALDNSKTHDYIQSEAETAMYGYGGIIEGYWDNVINSSVMASSNWGARIFLPLEDTVQLAREAYGI